MAKKDEKLEEAIALFRSGKSPRECEKETGVNFMKVSREAKKRGVEKGDLLHLVSSMTKDKEKLVTLSVTEQKLVTNEVEKRTKYLEFIHNATLKNATAMMKKVNEETTHAEHKMVQETIKTAGQVLGVLDDSKMTINNTAQSASGIEKKSDEILIKLV